MYGWSTVKEDREEYQKYLRHLSDEKNDVYLDDPNHKLPVLKGSEDSKTEEQ